jgi:predicted DsbA family dithiol-disulfide isomerase
MSRPIKIEFFHDTVCAWCFNLSSRLHMVAHEINLDIRHRTFVLQASRQEMAQRWGSVNGGAILGRGSDGIVLSRAA